MELPDWLPRDAWDGWVEMRKVNKWKLTERAKSLAVNRLHSLRLQGFDPGMVLDQSTFNCWRGLFPLRGVGDGDKADRKTFDAIRRDSSVSAIRRTVENYNKVGRDIHGAPPQGNKRIGDGRVH